MKKSIISVLMISALLGTFVSCDKKSKDKPVTISFAEVNPADSICGRMDSAFAQKVEELSNGTVTVQISYSGSAGDEAQILKMLFAKESPVQMARVSANLSAYGVPQSNLISIPYTFSSPEHFWKFAKSDIAQEILVAPYTNGLGVRGLCYAQEGFRHFFTTKKLTSVEDFAGKKMRVAGKVLPGIAEGLQAEPVKVAFTSLYAAMEDGTVEIAENPVTNYLANSFYKPAPYLILDGHMLGAVQILISSECWDSLSKKQQEAVTEAAQYASDYCKIICDEDEAQALAILESEGVTITRVSDIKPWQNACSRVIEESSKDYQELYKKIIALDE